MTTVQRVERRLLLVRVVLRTERQVVLRAERQVVLRAERQAEPRAATTLARAWVARRPLRHSPIAQ